MRGDDNKVDLILIIKLSLEVEIIVAENSESDVGDSDTTICLTKNLKLTHDDAPYSNELYLDICAVTGKEKRVIGELTGHYFNLARLNKDNKSDQIIMLLQRYNRETFEICKNLVRETMGAGPKNKSIYHLDRFYIQPQYRKNGAGRNLLKTFINHLPLFLPGCSDINYIGLYPDPITDNKKFDSMLHMEQSKRNFVVRKLRRFYATMGFKEMKIKPTYMYLDLPAYRRQYQKNKRATYSGQLG